MIEDSSVAPAPAVPAAPQPPPPAPDDAQPAQTAPDAAQAVEAIAPPVAQPFGETAPAVEPIPPAVAQPYLQAVPAPVGEPVVETVPTPVAEPSVEPAPAPIVQPYVAPPVPAPVVVNDPVKVVEAFPGWLKTLADTNGSDLHVKVGSAPMVRRDGRLERLDYAPLGAADTDAIARAILPAGRQEAFDERGSADFAHSLSGVGRFRVNLFHQRGSVSMVLRKVRVGGPSFADIDLPPVVEKLSDEGRGLILVTGPTCSGKTTTLAAMVEHINRTRPVHIVTVEDPIEVMHPDKMASINQREVGLDTPGFLTALRDAMREDPDVILIGEMRDTETVQAALQAAETGHLVLSTLHTVNATETINRAIDFFPPYQQQQIRLTLSGTLRGIVCQRLVRASGGGRIPCLEVLLNTGRVAERIADSMRTHEIQDVLSEGAYYGMRTFDQSLLELVAKQKVTIEDAMESSSVPHDFELALKQAQLWPETPGVPAG
jgi:twitching motility protein PilT